MKKMGEKIIKFLQENKINYYNYNSADSNDKVSLLIPYMITDRNEKVVVNMKEISEDIVQIGFTGKRNEEVDKEKLYDIIFEMNPCLINGSLSYEKESDKIKYIANLDICNGENLNIDFYNKHIKYLFAVYFSLRDKGCMMNE